MKEKDFISVIKNVLNSSYIGDDCAYLKDLGIVVTQDSLVEDVHFSRDFMTPYQLGYKSVMVNISDICASGGKCKYLTISLSLPKNIEKNFVKDFYEGAKKACGEQIKIIGGDITGADKVYVSVCAIGKTDSRNISSRSNAKEGYKIIVSGLHGSSAAGLKLLLSSSKSVNLSNKLISFNLSEKDRENIIKAHLEPEAQFEIADNAGKYVKEPYAMMDTSDGLMETLSTISDESKVLLKVKFDNIPHDKIIENFDNWQDMVLFGGEDYGIVAVVPQKYDIGGVVIGHVESGSGVDLEIGKSVKHYSKTEVDEKIFNHFDY